MMQNNEGWQNAFNLEKVQSRLTKSETSKRTDIKRTLISFPRQDTFGYRLERREDYITPLPCNGNNFYKNHSQISKKNIYRKYKGPLYNDAGRICIELT